MTIKQQGGIFGRNPTFNDVETNKLDVDNVNIDGNTISATDTNGDLTVEANGTGEVKIPSDVELNQGTKGILKFSGDSYKIEGGNNFGDIRMTFPRLRFFEGANLVGQFDSDNLTVNRGNVVIGTSGKGIDFSATSGTGTSELFDDYEEGNWTPTLVAASNFASVTYDTGVTFGVYTKVGNAVTINGRIRTDAVDATGASGAVRISGLPYTCGSNGSISISISKDWAGDVPSGGYISGTNIYLVYRATSNGPTINVDATDVGTGADDNDILFSATYQV